MNIANSFGLLLLALFVLPVLVSGCLPYGRNGVPWYEARRNPSGLAPTRRPRRKPWFRSMNKDVPSRTTGR